MILKEAADIVLLTREADGKTIPDKNVEQVISAMWTLLEAAMDGEDIRPILAKPNENVIK